MITIKNVVIYLAAILIFHSCTKFQEKTSSMSVTETITDQSTITDYSIGEKWVWLEKSVAEGKTRWEGEELLEVVEFNDTLGFWNGADTFLISSTLIPEQSKTPYRDWPLKVGKKWKYESNWVNGEGTPMITSQDVEVLSYGEVTVLAGRFMAYEIDYKGTITNTIGGSAEVNDIYWYAPALKTNIKHVQDDGYGSYVLELYDYKSGK